MKKKSIALSAIAVLMLGTHGYAGKIITDANLTNIVIEENKQFGFGGWNYNNVDVRIVDVNDFIWFIFSWLNKCSFLS